MKYKYLPILLSVAMSVQAANYSYIVASSQTLSDLENNLIVKKFSNGYIEKQDKYFVYKIGPFSSYQEAKESKSSVKNIYPTAFIVKNTLPSSAIVSDHNALSNENTTAKNVQPQSTNQSETQNFQDSTIIHNKIDQNSSVSKSASDNDNKEVVDTKKLVSIWDDVKSEKQSEISPKNGDNKEKSLSNSVYSCILASSKSQLTLEKKMNKKLFSNGYIEKQERYYVYKVGPFTTYQEAKESKKQALKYFPHAFIVKSVSADLNVVSKSDSKENALQEKNDQSKIVSFTDKRSEANINSPKLNIVKDGYSQNNEVLKPLKISDTSKYDNLYLQSYLSELFEHNENAKEAFFQQKIDYVLADIQKDKYNFDVYLNGAVSTGEAVNFATRSPSTLATATVNVNKRLYDGGYSLSDKYEAINKRLAEVSSINAKDRLALLGTALYYDLYNAQERVTMYKTLIEEQKNFKDTIQVKYKNGTSSILDYIDAKNDYVALQRTLSDANYQFLHNEYVLRQSIHSKSSMPLKLFAADVTIAVDLNSTTDIQERAIANNSDIAMESSLVKLKTADLINEQKRYYPTIDFTSSAGIANQNQKVFNFANNGLVGIWNLGLTANIPLYNRGDIRLNIQKNEYAVMLEENKFSSKIRDILNETQRSQTQLLRLNEQKKYVLELLSLAKKKLDTSKERYLKGLAQYRDYSEALNRVLGYQSDLITIESDIVKESFILSVIVGKREFYEQN